MGWTWPMELVEVLTELGGEAHLSEIESRVKGRGRKPFNSASIRDALESHCPEKNFRRRVALFYHKGRERSGVYGLIKPAEKSDTRVSETPENENDKIVIEDDEQVFDEQVFTEGKEVYRLHKIRERDIDVVRLAKKIGLKRDPLLRCQVCGFSFVKVYGRLGEGFIEAHHVVPLSELSEETKTKIEDIALVCPNCHKMLHRYRPWLSTMELKTIVKSNLD